MLPTNRSPRKALLLGVAVLLASLIVITTTYRIAASHTVPLSSTSSPTAKSAANSFPPPLPPPVRVAYNSPPIHLRQPAHLPTSYRILIQQLCWALTPTPVPTTPAFTGYASATPPAAGVI